MDAMETPACAERKQPITAGSLSGGGEAQRLSVAMPPEAELRPSPCADSIIGRKDPTDAEPNAVPCSWLKALGAPAYKTILKTVSSVSRLMQDNCHQVVRGLGFPVSGLDISKLQSFCGLFRAGDAAEVSVPKVIAAATDDLLQIEISGADHAAAHAPCQTNPPKAKQIAAAAKRGKFSGSNSRLRSITIQAYTKKPGRKDGQAGSNCH